MAGQTKVIQMVEDLKVGGLENVIAHIARGLDKNRYITEIWCIADGGAVAEELRASGCTVRILGIHNYHRPGDIFKLIRLLKESHPNIVHTHGYYAGTIGRITAWLAGVPQIFNHVHSTYWGYKRRHLLTEKILSLISKKIICSSQAIADFVIAHEKISAARVEVVYNGITPPQVREDKLPSLRQSLGIAPHETVITTVASLTPHKGHSYLIQAAAAVLKNHQTKFLFVGDGPMRRQLEQQTVELGISKHFVFTGIRRDISQLLGLTDFFILPSCQREGLGISIIEAMAQSKAAIGTNLGGIVEVIADNISGLLVAPADSQALAGAINSLLNDPAKTKKMGQAGFKIFQEKFTAASMVRQIEGLYEKTA